MSDRLEVVLVGRDNLSPAFKAATSGADSLGKGLDRLGTEGKQVQASLDAVGRESVAAGRSLTTLGASTEKAASGFAKSKAAGAALGATFGAMTGLLSDATRAFAESEAIAAQLEAQVEATGASYEEYADQIDAATAAAMQLAFDDELVAQSLSKLTSITNDAGEALDLLGLAMDVARGTGMNLVAASQLVGKVAEGNTGILQRYGIVVSEGATAQEALVEMQGRFAGQAEAYGNTQSAVFDRIQISLGNMMESIGASAGQFQTLLMVLPGLSAGFTGASAAIGAVGPGLLNAGKAAATARVGMLGMSVALGPIGLGLAAVAAGVAIAEATGLIDLFGGEAAEAAVKTDDFALALAQIRNQSGESLNLAWLDATITGLEAGVDNADAALEELMTRFNTVSSMVFMDQDMAGNALPDEFWSEYYRLSDLKGSAEQVDAITQDVVAALATPNIDKDKLIGVYRDIYTAWEASGESVDVLVTNIDAVNGSLADMIPVAGDAATATDALTRAQDVAIAKQVRRGQDMDAQREKLKEESVAAAALAETYRSALVPAIDGLGGSLAAAVPAGYSLLDTLFELQKAGQIDVGAAMSGIFDRIDEVDEFGRSVAALGYSWLDVSYSINNAAGNLDGVLALYGVIDGLSSRMASATSIANDLFGPDGNAWDGIGPMTDALNAGVIQQQTFNDAVAAGLSIQENSAEVELMLTGVRASQLPILADQTESYARQIEHLAAMAPAEQAHALAMLDSGNQAKVATAYSTAYSASLGEIPTDVATEIIASAAQADPVIGDLLEEMGLIEEGADGEIRVNFPDGESMVSVTQSLTESINALIVTMGGVPPEVSTDVTVDTSDHATGMESVRATTAALNGTSATVYALGDESNANNALARAVAALGDVDGDTGTVYVLGDESNANTALGRAVAALGGVDGSGATVYIYGDDSNLQAVLRNVPQGGVVGSGVVWIEAQGPGIGYTAYAHGGVVGPEGYAHGGLIDYAGPAAHGRVVMVGEAGRELVELPVGSRVISNPATEEMLKAWEREGRPGFASGGTVGGEYWGREDLLHLVALVEQGLVGAAKDMAEEFAAKFADSTGDMQSLGFNETATGQMVWDIEQAQRYRDMRDSEWSAQMGLQAYWSEAFDLAATSATAIGSNASAMTSAASSMQTNAQMFKNYGQTGIEDKVVLPAGWQDSAIAPATAPKPEGITFINHGTILGIDDMTGFIAGAMADSISGRKRELGMVS